MQRGRMTGASFGTSLQAVITGEPASSVTTSGASRPAQPAPAARRATSRAAGATIPGVGASSHLLYGDFATRSKTLVARQHPSRGYTRFGAVSANRSDVRSGRPSNRLMIGCAKTPTGGLEP